MAESKNPSPLSDAFYWYYNQGREQGRLLNASGQLEFVRTQEIIRRYLPPPPAVIDDVGGGAGIHALPLAQSGYTVNLVDAVPLHIEQALKAAKKQSDYPLASANVGDARQLDFPDESADMVLLLGPLYHLTEREDRILALREARRVLKPSGILIAAMISRFASLIDGFLRGALADPHFAGLVARDLIDGQHRNPTQTPGYFSTAYFHHPAEISTEIADAGFGLETILPVEVVGWLTSDFDTLWADEARREQLLGFLRTVENEPSLLGASGHLLAIARK
jgi:ubiquinone/menaquinone biosynthesis C-methylase UbiE